MFMAVPAEPVPFNYTVSWIWSSEGIERPRPEGEGPFRTRLFRRTFEAPQGAKLEIHVSADTQYRLWCNGTEVAFGPAKGDVEHQFYETVDVRALLREGTNVLAAQVVYVGDVWAEGVGGAPISRITACPGFVLWGILKDAAGAEIEELHSDPKWRVSVDRSCMHQDSTAVSLWLGATEEVFCERHPWGFQELGFDDSGWEAATKTVIAATPFHMGWSISAHKLVPRMIELLEVSEPRRFQDVFAGGDEGLRTKYQGMLEGKGAVTLPAGLRTKFLVRVAGLTTGYPELRFSGGAGAVIRLRYAEALTGADGRKGHRERVSSSGAGENRSPDLRGQEIDHRQDADATVRDATALELKGYCDIVHADGGERTYRPFQWRTFRFVAVEVEVGDKPLVLHTLTYNFTAYPFRELATFESSDPRHPAIWELCWRTARLCAHETYEDCPYYEQLQYGGDTQVQAMISYYVAGDASLARQWLYQYDWSRTSDGLTRSRYPASVPQTIPFWSLHWAMAVRDYWQHTGDVASVRELFPGVRAVLDYFDRRVTSQGIVGKLTGWQCADWCPQWTNQVDGAGVPPGTMAGHSAFVSLITAVTLDEAAELAAALGEDARELRERSTGLKAAVHKVFFDARRGLYRDTPEGSVASAYTNVWAILARMPCDLSRLSETILTDTGLCQLTMFSAYFAYRALAQAGRYDLAPRLLAPWPKMLEWGLSTCPEIPNYARTRSDCHAWSAGPLVEFCREILGVSPGAAGYGEIRIAPKPAGLRFARGRVPLTRLNDREAVRFVDVEWRIDGGSFILTAEAPAGVPCRVVLPGSDEKVFATGGRIAVTSSYVPA
jgi:hypothetical protein